jgi:hypothetical protein
VATVCENHFHATVFSQETVFVLLGTAVSPGMNTLARSGGNISSDSGVKQKQWSMHASVHMPTNTRSSW